MSIADRLSTQATTLINKFGKAVTFTKSQGVYNTDESEVTLTNTVLKIKAIVEEWPLLRRQTMSNMPTALVEAGDRILTAPASYFATRPVAGDTFSIDNESFTVVERGVQAIWAVDKVIFYIIVGRKQ